MDRSSFPVIVQRGHADGRQAALLRFHQHFNASCVQPSMGEHEHHVTLADRFVLKQHLRVPLSPLQPQQSLRAATSNHVGPHQPHVHQRTEARIRAISRKHVLHRQHRVPAPEHVHQPALRDRLRHRRGSLLNIPHLRFPNLSQHSTNPLAISLSAHNSPPLKFCCSSIGDLVNLHCGCNPRLLRADPGFHSLSWQGLSLLHHPPFLNNQSDKFSTPVPALPSSPQISFPPLFASLQSRFPARSRPTAPVPP